MLHYVPYSSYRYPIKYSACAVCVGACNPSAGCVVGEVQRVLACTSPMLHERDLRDVVHTATRDLSLRTYTYGFNMIR